MFNMKSHARPSMLLLAYLAASKALSFADEAASAAAGTAPSPVVKGASEQVKRTIAQPVVDVSQLDDEQVRSMLQQLLAKQGSQRDATKTIRFNDGTDPTHYVKGEKLLSGKGVAEGGEVKSARDSGTVSIYGFGRQPLSLYANQWLELLQFATAIIEFIGEKREHINKYVQQRNNGKADRDIDAATIEALKLQFGMSVQSTEQEPPAPETEETTATAE